MTEVDTKAYTITNADRFAPHITMRYVDPDNAPPLPVLDGPIDLPVNRISLVVGDERQDFDLGAPDGSHKMAVKEFDESLHPRDDRGRFGSGSSDSSVEGNSRLLAMEQDGLPSGATAASAAKQEVASRIAADMTSTTPAIVAAAAGDRGAGHTQVALQYLGDPNVVIATTGTGSLYVGRTVDAATWAAAHPEAGSIDPAWGTMSVNGPPYVGSLAEFAANPTEAIGMPVESFITADDPMASQVIREAAVSNLVGGWAATSNDEDPRSLALQDTATAMFGGTPAPWQTTPAMDARIGALMSTNGPVYQDFLQAQYNATQSELKAAGITEVTGWRGVNFGGHDAVTAPAWAGALGPGQSTTVEANLRPLSSWTTVPSVAERFAAGLGTGTTSPGYMMQTSIPVDRILSWPRTGLGCLAEHEMVVLNGPGNVTVTATAPAKTVAHATKAAGPVDINFDEDWIKTLSWDLPTNAADLRAMGFDPAHLATLPCGVAMPAALRASLERPAKRRRPRYAVKGALLPAGASIATHRSRLESEAHARREAVLKQILPVIRRQFDRQKKTTLARLGGEKARKGTRYWRPANGSAPVVTRQIKASDVFNADTWSEDWTGDLTPTMTDVFSAEGADAADEMDAAWDPENDDDLQAAIAAIVAKQVGNSALAIKTTQDRIDALIKAAEDGSWDQSTLTDEVGSYFDAPARQSEIATVLAVGAIAGAGLLAATIAGSAPTDGGAGAPMMKSWLSRQDQLVRESHAEADDGSFIPIDEPFNVGGEDMMYPCDPSGSAENTINCRCILLFSPGPDTAQPDQTLEPDYTPFTEEASAPHWLLERKVPPAPHWVLKRKETAPFVCELPPAPPRTSLVLNLKAFDESLHPRDDHGRFGSGGGSDTGRPALTSADVSSATPAEFHARFTAAIATSPYINHVTNHTAAEIAAEHMIPLTTNGGQTGVLIHDHGDGRIEATGLYNQSQVPGAGTDLLRYAVANNGVNYVEAYGPRLPELYAKAGFVTTEAYPFDPSQAAPGWNYPAFDNPDYHIMTIPGRL